MHELQRTGDDRATGLPRVEEFLLIDFLRNRVVANENHFGFFVVAFQEHVEEQIEAFRHVFDLLIHRTGHIHQTEHHGLRSWNGLFDMQVVAQIVRVKERHTINPLAQVFDLLAQLVRRNLVPCSFRLHQRLFGDG